MHRLAFAIVLSATATTTFALDIDLNGDGSLDVLPPQTLVADLDKNGAFELLHFSGARLLMTNGRPGDLHERTLPADIAAVHVRDVDRDGTRDLEVVLVTGDVVTLHNADLPYPATHQPAPTPIGGDAPRSPCGPVEEIWNSGADLNNVWGAAGGDFDDDGKGDLLAENWPTPTMRVYETDGNDSFTLVFETPTGHAPPGAYVTVTGGDSDGDGQPEIIGGETSTLNQVFLYEATGDNEFTRRDVNIKQPDATGQKSMGKVRIADTDRDGKAEIIFDTSGVQGSIVYIYEHTGSVGENVYARVYFYSTVSYLFNWGIGDSDNDGKTEIILGFGGFGGNPTYLRRLENDGDNLYVHKMVEPGSVGLALAPSVGDLDADNQNELVFGAAPSGLGGGIFIYEAIADDTYQVVHVEGGLAGNGLSSTIGRLQCGPEPLAAIGSFEGSLQFWRHAAGNYEPVLTTPINTGGAIRTVGLGHFDVDQKPDAFASAGGAPDAVFVYEVGDITGDMNCDGLVDFADINPFVLALTDPAGYAVAFPGCSIQNADINQDGKINFGDINPFVALLTGP